MNVSTEKQKYTGDGRGNCSWHSVCSLHMCIMYGHNTNKTLLFELGSNYVKSKVEKNLKLLITSPMGN